MRRELLLSVDTEGVFCFPDSWNIGKGIGSKGTFRYSGIAEGKFRISGKTEGVLGEAGRMEVEKCLMRRDFHKLGGDWHATCFYKRS